jgi:radical SAM protein with 4Fe4S-binding SPASM domain
LSRTFVDSIAIQDLPLWEKRDIERGLFSFELELTARCTSNCRHCYIRLPADDAHARSLELQSDEIARIADEAVSMGALWCLITGGEPLLRRDFGEIYTMLKRKGLLVSVFTNAQCITDEHVALFRKYTPRDIEITIYGTTRQIYEGVTRTSGSFDAFMRGFDRLKSAGIPVRLKAMALRSNVSELPEIARFCRQNTKDYFRFDPLLHLRFDGDCERNEEIRSERLSPEEIASLDVTDEERAAALRHGCEDLIPSKPTADANGNCLFRCGAGNDNLCVGYDGTFRLCAALCHPDCTADLRKQSLRDVWNALVPKVRKMQSERREYSETCGTCPLFNLCLWCPAHAHLETGNLDGPVPYFCKVAKARANALKIVD